MESIEDCLQLKNVDVGVAKVWNPGPREVVRGHVSTKCRERGDWTIKEYNRTRGRIPANRITFRMSERMALFDLKEIKQTKVHAKYTVIKLKVNSSKKIILCVSLTEPESHAYFYGRTLPNFCLVIDSVLLHKTAFSVGTSVVICHKTW